MIAIANIDPDESGRRDVPAAGAVFALAGCSPGGFFFGGFAPEGLAAARFGAAGFGRFRFATLSAGEVRSLARLVLPELLPAFIAIALS